MRILQSLSLAACITILGGSLAIVAGADEPPTGKPRTFTARVSFGFPAPPRYISTMLGADAASIESDRLTAQRALDRINVHDIASAVARDATLEKRVPEYFARFDPEDAEYDRAALARDLESRIKLSRDGQSELLELRVSSSNEALSAELCDIIADAFEFGFRDAHIRRLNQVRESAARMQRSLRTDEEAIRAQCQNLIVNESLESNDPASSSTAAMLTAVSQKLVDVELELAGTAEDDPASAAQRTRRDWLRARQSELVKQSNTTMYLTTRLRSLERDLESRENNRAAVDRALLIYEEALDAPAIVRINQEPVTDSQ